MTDTNHTALHIKTHAMTTHHGGTGCTSKGKDHNPNIDDARGIDTGLDNDNESISSLYTTIAFGRFGSRWPHQ